MVNDVDKSLLDRLQALRGGPAGGQPSQAPQNIKVDVIERAKTPSREDALTARLRSLREGSATPEPERQRASPNPAAATAAAAPQPAPTISEKQNSTTLPAASSNKKYQEEEEEEEVFEHVFETDDDTLQELLADVTPDEDPGGGVSGAHEPSDEQVRALLEKLADDIPKDLSDPQPTHDHELDSDNDGSDSEAMRRQVKDVVERYQDEAGMEEEEEETQSKRQESKNDDDDDDFQDPHDEAAAHNADLPSVPSDLQDPLPWCTVCLADATLRCLGCDDDVYCARCWHEMHVGPAAAFDDRSHRAVQFTRDRKKKEAPKKVALGA
ncbi:Abscission/NoCut checkpoint regulator [Beauveria bassiana]|nr:Abscission/NoCut checkpoint regulator [Beauveria bassiana]